jgi:predicted lipid-binding transport protein (Tim44 family)
MTCVTLVACGKEEPVATAVPQYAPTPVPQYQPQPQQSPQVVYQQAPAQQAPSGGNDALMGGMAGFMLGRALSGSGGGGGGGSNATHNTTVINKTVVNKVYQAPRPQPHYQAPTRSYSAPSSRRR